MATSEPVGEGEVRRLELDAGPRDRRRLERADLERLSARSGLAADDAGLERDHDDGRLQARVETDDLARLDDQARLLERLADRALGDGFIDLQKAARLGPRAEARLE